MSEMTAPRVEPFLTGSISEGNLCVGARYTSDGSSGPVASVTLEKNGRGDVAPTWIIISTDDHEGSAMLHVEALPLLIEALQQAQAHLSKLPTHD